MPHSTAYLLSSLRSLLKMSSSPPVDLMGDRQKALQRSQESLGAAEERYNTVKESAVKASGYAKEAAVHGLGATELSLGSAAATAADKIKQAAEYVAEKGLQAKDVAVEKGLQAYSAAKGKAASGAGAVADYTRQTTGQTKEMLVDKAAHATDSTINAAKKAVWL